MKKKSVNPAMAMMAARARRMPAVKPAPMAAPMAAPSAMPTGMPPAMPGMKKGGETMKSDKAQDKAMIKKAMKQHDMQEHKGGKGTKLSLCGGGKAMKKYASGGKASQLSKANGIAVRGKTKGKIC
jgi:hypothetical protein